MSLTLHAHTSMKLRKSTTKKMQNTERGDHLKQCISHYNRNLRTLPTVTSLGSQFRCFYKQLTCQQQFVSNCGRPIVCRVYGVIIIKWNYLTFARTARDNEPSKLRICVEKHTDEGSGTRGQYQPNCGIYQRRAVGIDTHQDQQ